MTADLYHTSTVAFPLTTVSKDSAETVGAEQQWESEGGAGPTCRTVTAAAGRPIEARRTHRARTTSSENPTPSIESRTMTTKTPYERRITRVRDVVREYSELDDSAATALAVQVLRALDSIPEKIR